MAKSAGVPAEVVGQPEAALRRAMTAAEELAGATLVTGSHYLLGYAENARLGRGASPRRGVR
jgi:hypothetical protein